MLGAEEVSAPPTLPRCLGTGACPRGNPANWQVEELGQSWARSVRPAPASEQAWQRVASVWAMDPGQQGWISHTVIHVAHLNLNFG